MASFTEDFLLLDHLISTAKSFPIDGDNRRIVAAVTDKKGRLLSIGVNSYEKTHPLQAKYAKQASKPDKVFLHAEIAALVKVRNGIPHKIYIARVNKAGEPCLAAPCEICQLAIEYAGIEEIEYTTGDHHDHGYF